MKILPKSKFAQVGVVCVLVAASYFIYEGKISTRHIQMSGENSPSCHLDLEKASARDIAVRIAVLNPTRFPVGVADRFLPEWNRVETKLFEVDRDGSAVKFTGRFVERVTRPTDLLRVEPGTEASVRVSLTSAGYDVPGHGKFTVTFSTVVWSGGKGLACTSNALIVQK